MKKIIIILSAVFSVLATVLLFVIVFDGMDKTLFKNTELTEAESSLIRELGSPTWKSYLVSYFMLLSFTISSILLVFASIKNGGSCASISVILTVLGTILSIFPIKDVLTEKSNLLYDKNMCICAVGLIALSFLLLTVYSIILSRSEKKK